jgi:protein-tyrosine phosphatase
MSHQVNRIFRVSDSVIIDSKRAGIIRAIHGKQAIIGFPTGKQKLYDIKQLRHYIHGTSATYPNVLKWSKIAPFPTGATLYLSGLPNNQWDLDKFEQHNVQTVVSIMERQPVDIPLRHVKHHFFPLDDSPSEDIRQYFRQVSSIIFKSIRKGKSVLVHCMAGISRSVSLIIAFFLSCLPCYPEWVTDIVPQTDPTWTLSILKHIRNKRNIAGPNIGFIHQLLRYEKEMLRTIC